MSVLQNLKTISMKHSALHVHKVNTVLTVAHQTMGHQFNLIQQTQHNAELHTDVHQINTDSRAILAPHVPISQLVQNVYLSVNHPLMWTVT